MNISKIASQSFKGLIKLKGECDISAKKSSIPVLNNISSDSRRTLKKLFSGNYMSIDNFNNVQKSDENSYSGDFYIDTDRINAITPDKIHLTSADGNVKGIFCYNPELNPIRQLLAINAYSVAKQHDTVIEID